MNHSISVGSPKPAVPVNPWLRWLPSVILLLGAIVLLLNWNNFPERWAVHWTIGGQPDRWATKTPLMIFFPLLAGLVINLFLEFLATVIVKNPRTHSNAEISPEAATMMAGLTGDFLRLINLFIALLFSILATALPLVMPQGPALFVALSLIMVLIPVIIGLVRFKNAANDLKRRGLTQGIEGWNGVIYNNPNDPRLFVPKLFTPGYTFNFANRWAWPITLLLIAIPVLVILAIVSRL